MRVKAKGKQVRKECDASEETKTTTKNAQSVQLGGAMTEITGSNEVERQMCSDRFLRFCYEQSVKIFVYTTRDFCHGASLPKFGIQTVQTRKG